MTKNPWGVVVGSALVVAACVANAAAAASPPYQVWVADQNANRIYVLDPGGTVVREVELSAAGGQRPHVAVASPGADLVFVANTVSNSVSVHRASDGAVVAVVERVGKAPHAAQPHPKEPDKIYVCNIAPQAKDEKGEPDAGETITEIVRAEGGWQIGRRLDLAAAPALTDPARFPSRRPVLVGFSADGRYLLVSLFHGGAAAVDLAAWRVTRAWGSDEVRRHATVVTPSPDGGELYVTAGDRESSWLYVFDAEGEPRLAASHDLSAFGKDAHGAAVDPVRRELWVVHRASDNATVHPLAELRSKEHVPATVDFVGHAPDLIEIAPDGSRAYVTLRGPEPAPTIPFPLAGKTPGVAILDVPGRKLWKKVELGDPVKGDFHGVAIVRTPP
jgi:DNA-binding beta-propeller fold protein YncE